MALKIPADFIESKVFINPRGMMVNAKTDGGQTVTVPGGGVVTLKEDHEDSVVFDNPQDGLLGPKGLVAMPKELIGFITRMSSIEQASVIPMMRRS